MGEYNTGNSVPSSAMPDAWDNNATIDGFVNSPELTVITRTGIEHDTLSGIQKKSDDQRVQMAEDGAAVVEETRQNLIPLGKQYMTLADAQADIANIPDGSTTYVRSADGSSLADEYINNGGTLEATGRLMPSQGYVDRVINTSTGNGNITVTFDSDGKAVDVRDDFGGVNIPGIPAPVQDILQQVKKNASPYLNTLTDAENAAYHSVDEYGHLRLAGMPDSMQERLDGLKKRVDEMRKRRMVLDVRECGRHGEGRESSTRRIQRGLNWLSGEGGGFLYNPPGHFELYQPVVPRSGVSLLGRVRMQRYFYQWVTSLHFSTEGSQPLNRRKFISRTFSSSTSLLMVKISSYIR
ncbi:hypothetical protein [Raoultella ornithinolytica]|uniref:hypothetical protein n=1 Tax=Raoultella ornithinolytica TaxID=54291 RepID=UPI00396A27B4